MHNVLKPIKVSHLNFHAQIIISICVYIASFRIFEFLRQFWPKWHLYIMSAVVVK